MNFVKVKRIYDEVEKSDGKRILVDRLWPRGVRKEAAQLDAWLKDIGPSNELRKWFNHEPEKFPKFEDEYKEELNKDEQQTALQKLIAIAKEAEKITLLTAARETKYNHVQILAEIIRNE